MVLTDPPYGTTACKWDSIIPLEPMWENLKRLAKKNAAIVMTASQPFTTTLIGSNMAAFAYEWIWNKGVSASSVQAKRMPMRIHENVVVFSMGGKTPQPYNPQMTRRNKPVKYRGKTGKSDSIPVIDRPDFNPVYVDKYPETIYYASPRVAGQRGLHPTQKPVALMEYLIKTYTNEGDTVLDFTMGSGTTGVACKNLGRNFIGIEKDAEYYGIAKKRIEAQKVQV